MHARYRSTLGRGRPASNWPIGVGNNGRFDDPLYVPGQKALLSAPPSCRETTSEAVSRRPEDFTATPSTGKQALRLERYPPRFGSRWRPGRRHEIELAYLLTGRSADKTLSREIAFGDTTFTAGLRVHSQFDDSRLLLTYRFAIVVRESWQFGVGVGLGAFFINPTLDALAGGESRNVEYSQSTSAIGPTASLGLYGRFLLSPTWYLETDARALAGSVDRYTVRIFEGGVALRHFITRQWGFEGAYGYSGIRLDIGPRTGLVSLASGRFKYSLQEARLGVVFHP